MPNIRDNIQSIVKSTKLDIKKKIYTIMAIREDISNLDDDLSLFIDNSIEDIFGQGIRAANEETNIEKQKKAFSLLYDLIHDTLDWNIDKKDSIFGIVNRAALRSMLKDPSVSRKTKQEIMDNWENFM